jgi:hypothetical protein
MEGLLFFMCLQFVFYSAFSQNDFDKSLNEVSQDIAVKLNKKDIKKLVVLYVTDIDKGQTTAGKYIADIISVNLVNDVGEFEVFDRGNLSGIADAKKLIDEGYIDASQAKALGKLLAVEVIIIGNYTTLPSHLKLTLKALDVNSGLVIAATMKDLPITKDTGKSLGISVESLDNDKSGNIVPLTSSESNNNFEKEKKDCEANNTGDYCFINNSNQKLSVIIKETEGRNSYNLIIGGGETQCFYNIKAILYQYEIYSNGYSLIKTGQILVEKCKSKTFVITFSGTQKKEPAVSTDPVQYPKRSTYHY